MFVVTYTYGNAFAFLERMVGRWAGATWKMCQTGNILTSLGYLSTFVSPFYAFGGVKGVG
jgi:hypothetical protein